MTKIEKLYHKKLNEIANNPYLRYFEKEQIISQLNRGLDIVMKAKGTPGVEPKKEPS